MANRYFIYGTTSCPFCKKAVETLKNQDIEYCFFNLDDDEGFLKEVKSFYGHSTVPIILENNMKTGETNFVGGCDNLLEVLDD